MKNLLLILTLMGVGSYFTSCTPGAEDSIPGPDSDSVRKDSIMRLIRDSLAHSMIENNTASFQLPDKNPENPEEALAQLEQGANDTIRLWMRTMTEDEFAAEVHLGFGMHLKKTEKCSRKYFHTVTGGNYLQHLAYIQ